MAVEVNDYGGAKMKICIVSSCGGSLTEVRALKPVYERDERFYVLNDRAMLRKDMEAKADIIRHSERDSLAAG